MPDIISPIGGGFIPSKLDRPSRRDLHERKRDLALTAAEPSLVRRRLTIADKEMIDRLAAKGWKPGPIAARLSRHASTIHVYMVTHGLVAAGRTVRPTYARNGATVKAFTAEEDALIEEWRALGWTYQRIADASHARFGHRRTTGTIGIRLRMLAGRQALADD